MRGEGVSKSARCPEPVQTGRGEVWFGYQRLSLMLRVETVEKKTLERRIPHPEEVGRASASASASLLFCVAQPAFSLVSWQPHNNKTPKIILLERQMSDMDSLSVVSLEI